MRDNFMHRGTTDMWSMTIENTVNAIISLRVVVGTQPEKTKTFVLGVNQKFMPGREDRLVVPPFSEPAQVEAVEWSICPRHYLMPFVKASIRVLRLEELEVKSLLKEGWENEDDYKEDLKCSKR